MEMINYILYWYSCEVKITNKNCLCLSTKFLVEKIGLDDGEEIWVNL